MIHGKKEVLMPANAPPGEHWRTTFARRSIAECYEARQERRNGKYTSTNN